MWNGLVDESSGRGRRWNRERHCDYCCGIVEANRINPNSSQLKVATITTPPMAVDLLKFSCKSATSKHPIVRHRGRNLELIYDLRQPCLATADFGTAGHKETTSGHSLLLPDKNDGTKVREYSGMMSSKLRCYKVPAAQNSPAESGISYRLAAANAKWKLTSALFSSSERFRSL